jgi:Fe-S oxidoreductase
LAGEQGLFEVLAEKNGKEFSKYKFNEIITTDPHAFNAFKNEYPKLGIKHPVRHYTEFLTDKIDQLKPLLKKELKARVTFHDPCYLGRVNKIYEEPRSLLEIIPGVELVEMAHNCENSICCGGGGGGMWMDGFIWSKAQIRTSDWRIREAITTRANVLATACPYEIPRFDDARKNVTGKAWELFGLEEHPGESALDKAVEIVRLAKQMKIKDISELIYEAF